MWSKLQDKYVSNSTGQDSKYMRRGKAVSGSGPNGAAVISTSHSTRGNTGGSGGRNPEDEWTSSEEE